MAQATSTNFVPQAPVQLVSPNGRVRGFGFGATSDSARGTALDAALDVSASGDVVRLIGGTFELGSATTIPSGVSLTGVGRHATSITANLSGKAVTCSGSNTVKDLRIVNPHSAGVAIGGSAATVSVLSCQLSAGFDSIEPSGSGPWIFDGCYFEDFAFDGCNSSTSSLLVQNCAVNASPTSASEVAFINAPSGTVTVINCDVNLSRASNEGALAFIKCGAAGSGVYTSKNNRVKINAGTQAAYGFSTFSFGVATFYSYDDQIDLTGSGSSYHFKASVSGTTFNYRGGNVSSHNGTGTLNVLSQGGVSVGTFNGVTPGATGLALLDDTTPSNARTTLGVDQGNAPIQRTSSLGVTTVYGVGAANSSALGTAVLSAVSAASSGDVIIAHSGQYDFTSSVTLPANVSLVGVGQPKFTGSGLTNPLINVVNSNVIVEGLTLSSNVSALGGYSASEITAEGCVFRDITILTSGSTIGVSWAQSSTVAGATEHTVKARFHHVESLTGFFGVFSEDTELYLFDCIGGPDVSSDAVLFQGSAAGVAYLFGGNYRAELDAVTSGGLTIRAYGTRARGDQSDFFGDGGNVYLTGCDYRANTIASDVYEVIGGAEIPVGDGAPPVLPVLHGGTGGDTATTARASLGATASTLLRGSMSSATVVASSTYYGGGLEIQGWDSLLNIRSIRVPVGGTIRAVSFSFYNTATASAQTSSLYIRKNNTTDYLISSSVVNNSSETGATVTGLSIPVSSGDLIVFKWVTPAWSVTPGTPFFNYCIDLIGT